jgi:hypothetical protein
VALRRAGGVIGPGGRVALYYAPADDDPLSDAAAAWLGRNPSGRRPPPPPDVVGLADVTAEARLYGLHATLRPPMRLREGADWGGLCTAVAAVAATIPPFRLPPLVVGSIGGFLALRESDPSPALQAYCDACVAGVDHYRAECDAAELARRRTGARSAAETANIARWGYPYVFATWFFHMTLSRRLSGEEHAHYFPAATTHFATSLARPRIVSDIALFVQPGPGEPFAIAERIRLTG